MSVYWFAILLLVAIGVFIMVYNFHHYPYDVREIEANIMVNKVADCISTGGRLDEYVLEQDFEENFLHACNLNFETKEWEDMQYYLEVEIPNAFIISEGNKNLVSSCGIESQVEEDNLARCMERSFYALDATNNAHLIKILSVVRKTEKNVR